MGLRPQRNEISRSAGRRHANRRVGIAGSTQRPCGARRHGGERPKDFRRKSRCCRDCRRGPNQARRLQRTRGNHRRDSRFAARRALAHLFRGCTVTPMHEKVQRKFFGAILRYLRACNVGPHRLVLNDHEAGSLLFDLEQEHLHQWMPFSATAREVIWRMRSRVRSIPWSIGDDEVTTLEGALGRENVEHLAQEIVDFLASIPYPSTFWARLRGVKLALTEPVDLGPFRLRTVGQAHATPEDLLPDNIFAGRGRPGLSVGEMPRAILRADDIVLEIGVSGYSSHKISDSSPIQALSLLKEFLTLADAVEVLAPNRRAEPDDAPALMLGE